MLHICVLDLVCLFVHPSFRLLESLGTAACLVAWGRVRCGLVPEELHGAAEIRHIQPENSAHVCSYMSFGGYAPAEALEGRAGGVTRDSSGVGGGV